LNELARDEDFIGDLTVLAGVYYLYVTAGGEDFAYHLALHEGLPGDAGGGVLAFGTTVSGRIEPRGDVDVWSFAAQPGEVAVINLRPPTGSQLAGELLLYDPAGNQLVHQAALAGRSARLVYLVPAAGEYQLLVQGLNHNSTGIYRLNLARAANADENVTLRHFQPRPGLAPPGGAQAWQFQGQAGEQVVITADAIDQGFDPFLILYGPDGAEIGRDDDGGEGLNARLEITLPATGFYTASVTSYDGSSGRYRIEVRRP
jgi:hypothetical protein